MVFLCGGIYLMLGEIIQHQLKGSEENGVNDECQSH